MNFSDVVIVFSMTVHVLALAWVGGLVVDMLADGIAEMLGDDDETD